MNLDWQRWPDALWLVRHGESAGNVALAQAEAAGHSVVNMPLRDMDVPLSALGAEQAAAVGRWFGAHGEETRPTVMLVSPYLRTRATAEILGECAGFDFNRVPFVTDERLREKEFGIFDRLTKLGARKRYPEQAAYRTVLGKFYYRPPGGESWCDVILRLRSVVDDLARDYRRERVLIVAHQVVVNCFRYLLEQMTEEEILAIDRQIDVPNCSVTSYEYDQNAHCQGRLVLQRAYFTAPLEQAGTPVTVSRDVPVAPK
jgi:broad specificity phosphatase PhoE